MFPVPVVNALPAVTVDWIIRFPAVDICLGFRLVKQQFLQ